MSVTRFDLLRHGACTDGQVYRGHTDSPLSDEGELQMQETVKEGQWDIVYSSPLRRCQGFSSQLSKQRQLPLVIDKRLIEMDFGDWDGCETAAIWARQKEAVLAFWQDPETNTPPDAEPLSTMRERLVQLLHDLHRQHEGKKILLVCHGGVIRLLLCYLLQIPPNAMQQLTIGYASLSRIELYQSDDHFGSEVVFSNRLPDVAGYEGR